MRHVLRISALMLAFGVTAAAQQARTPAEREAELAARIQSLAARLDYRDDNRAEKDRYYEEMDRLTANVRDRIDEYVQTHPDLPPEQRQFARLAALGMLP